METIQNLTVLNFLLKNKSQMEKHRWDSKCKVFIGGLRYNVTRRSVSVSVKFPLLVSFLQLIIYRKSSRSLVMWSIAG